MVPNVCPHQALPVVCPRMCTRKGYTHTHTYTQCTMCIYISCVRYIITRTHTRTVCVCVCPHARTHDQKHIIEAHYRCKEKKKEANPFFNRLNIIIIAPATFATIQQPVCVCVFRVCVLVCFVEWYSVGVECDFLPCANSPKNFAALLARTVDAHTHNTWMYTYNICIKKHM